MRPPEFTGGNSVPGNRRRIERLLASMRPPEFTGGNAGKVNGPIKGKPQRFNEAAGIHRRKRRTASSISGMALRSFNEAAGIHRRKQCQQARPPIRLTTGFNEAAGIHRRKRNDRVRPLASPDLASMRPPEFTGGNLGATLTYETADFLASMRPPEFTGGN